MWLILMALLMALPVVQATPQALSPAMQADVDRLVRAAERLTGTWPSMPPPAIPEVAVVARYGRPVVPLLTALLSDDPNAESDRKRWKVQQQVSLTLSRIYEDPAPCGRTYCDGDPRERIALVKQGWLEKIALDAELRALSTAALLERFKREPMFFRQFEVGRALAASGDRQAIGALEADLELEDRHARGNVAYVLARLGDPRGFLAIARILADRMEPRAPGQGTGAKASVHGQIVADRYYAAHLLGDLRDPRGVPLLIPLLDDSAVYQIVPWSLGEIGGAQAIAALLKLLDRDDPSVLVRAMDALEKLGAREALPRLQELLNDKRPVDRGYPFTVADVARRAIATIAPER